MGKAIGGAFVKSSITTLIPDLKWIGVSREVRANITKTDLIIGAGLSQMNSRFTFKRTANTEIAVTSYIADAAYENLTNKSTSFDLLDYLNTVSAGTGFINPANYTSLLSTASINFIPRQAVTGTFSSLVLVPDDQLIDYLEEQSPEETNNGTGTQLDPLIGEESVVKALAASEGFQKIEGISNLTISINTKIQPMESIDGIYTYYITAQPDVNVNLTMYEKYFLQNQSLFDGSQNLSDISVGPFTIKKPRIVSASQNVTAESYKVYEVTLRGKNLLYQGD